MQKLIFALNVVIILLVFVVFTNQTEADEIYGCLKKNNGQPVIHQNPVVRVCIVAGKAVPTKSVLGSGAVRWMGKGSGFVVSSEGHIVTNAHVVFPHGATWRDTSIFVTVDVDSRDERTYPADIIASDQALDLAVLKMSGTWSGLAIATLGFSRDASVGSLVELKGYPRGGPYKETIGKVTKMQSPADSGTPSGVITSDVEAVPGNSGGPLVSSDGTVLGVAVKALLVERIEEIDEKSASSLRVAKKGDEVLKSLEGNADAIMRMAQMAGIKSAELDAKYRETKTSLSENRKWIKSAIQALSELDPRCLSIPVDAVRDKLAEWRVPFEGVAISCNKNCKKMFEKGELKKDVTVEECIKVLCN